MYSHFSKQQRIELSILLKAGHSLRQAAKLLGVHHSTVSRELRKNKPTSSKYRYHALEADRQVKSRRLVANQRFRKILPGSKIEQTLIHLIKDLKWSPEQCSGWLKTYRPRLYVCTQTIYVWIYKCKRELLKYLHCLKGKYRRTRANKARKEKRALLASPRNISKRPSYVNKRKTYGHWEGDTIHGHKHSGYIATFVERKSGYLTARLITKQEFGSIGFAEATNKGLGNIPRQYLKTLTLDNGPEMKLADRIEKQVGIDIYYANPYHSWERGINENTNGLLRYFFPKKMSFAHLTQEDIDYAVYLLNTRPRKRHNWRTPEQMFRYRGGALWNRI